MIEAVHTQSSVRALQLTGIHAYIWGDIVAAYLSYNSNADLPSCTD